MGTWLDRRYIQNYSCFHSISFPNEWGRFRWYCLADSQTLVSIQLVSPTSGDECYDVITDNLACFHSISFPNEWGPSCDWQQARASQIVSIQLVSPTSGDWKNWRKHWKSGEVSIQLVSPTSGDSELGERIGRGTIRFHSISFPNEWGHPL